MQERYSEILTCIYVDYAGLCGVKPDNRDLTKISRRCHHEGSFFAEVVLPSVGRGLERALERGYVDSTDFSYVLKNSAKCPVFLWVFFSLVFDDKGQLRLDAAPLAVAAIRQISNTFKKIKEVCDAKKVDEAFQTFRAIEQELSCNSDIPERWRSQFDFASRMLWGGLRSINTLETIPRHGPGAVAERVRGYDKYTLIQQQWHSRLQGHFPFDAFAISSISDIDILDECKFIEEEEEQPVRVIAVPKTATKPRIIAIEPTCMQYTQQAVAKWIIHHLEEVNDLTKGHLNFTDQSINSELALESSRTRKNATLDMSDASDRVPLIHVKRMLQSCPEFFEVIDACRSRRADVGGVIIPLSKFASMGSALCFPIEAMYFYTICVCGLIGDREPTYELVKRACKSIYVYGDDIVVPTDDAPSVMSVLTAFGNRVNTDKSFWKGFFRESCGTDAYMGSDVTPVYIRKHYPSSHTSPDWQSLVETSNQFYKIGLWLTADCIAKAVQKVIGSIPVAETYQEGLHFVTFGRLPYFMGLPMKRRRYNRHLQRMQYRVHTVSLSYKRQRGVRKEAFLLASLLRLRLKPTSEDRLGQLVMTKSDGGFEGSRKAGKVVQPGTGTLKFRWI